MNRNRILALLTCLILTVGAVFSFSGCFLFEPKPEEPVEYTVTFDAGEHGTLETDELTTEDGKLAALPVPAVDTGYTFAGWYTAETDGTQITDGYVFTADTTLYARYTKNEYTITLIVGEYGTLTTTKLTTQNGMLASLPAPTVKTGYTFAGWYTAPTGGSKVAETKIYKADTTLYARYTKTEYTITFNAGTLGTLPAGTSTTQKTVNGKISTLPVPTAKDGNKFAGWYTAQTGGTRVNSDYAFTANTTLYARYSTKFLHTDGTSVKTNDGNTVYLRGVNAGGLFVTEHWMTGFQGGKTQKDDYKSLTKKFIERFGADKTKALWAEYRANWWTEQDFKNCADMGMTVIRLPFTYMNVDFDAITDYANAGKNYDFSALEEFVDKAWEYGLYTVLDLHGAYGSQNGQDHSGDIKNAADVDFYSNTQMQTLTVKLWGALSEHFKDNPAVAGYDILNEPGERKAEGGVQVTTTRHWNVFDKIYKEIRKTGDEHTVIFESCWDGWNLPHPSQYGWSNCIYSFHHYVDDQLSVDGHVSNWQNKLNEIASRNFGIPLQMGEFTAYTSTEKWEKTLDMLEDNNWHWTSWTYKVWGSMPWGIINITSGGAKVDAANDSYDNIVNKFKKLRTESAVKYTFGDSGKTLESIFKYKLTGIVEPSVKINKVSLIADGGKAYAVFSGNCTINEIKELQSYVIDHEINSRIKLTLEITKYDEATGDFEMKAEITSFAKGRHYLHAGFADKPENLPSNTAQIDENNSKITVGNKTYSLGEQYGCRQIVVE